MIRPTHICTVCGSFWKAWEHGWQFVSGDLGPCCDTVFMGDQIEELVDGEPMGEIALPPDVEAIIHASRMVYHSQCKIHEEETPLKYRAAFGGIAELHRCVSEYDKRVGNREHGASHK